MLNHHRVTAIIPALNEAPVIRQVIEGLLNVYTPKNERLFDEIIVCDNGSIDDTALIASDAGAHVIYVKKKGYGAACQAGIKAIVQTDIVLFIDGDNTFCPKQSLTLCGLIERGADLAIGCRTTCSTSMPWYQYLGNRLLCTITSQLFNTPVDDIGPYRAIKYVSLQSLNMSDLSYGWTLEMQIKALKYAYDIQTTEVVLSARTGSSKISGNPVKAFWVGCYMLSTIFKLRFN